MGFREAAVSATVAAPAPRRQPARPARLPALRLRPAAPLAPHDPLRTPSLHPPPARPVLPCRHAARSSVPPYGTTCGEYRPLLEHSDITTLQRQQLIKHVCFVCAFLRAGNRPCSAPGRAGRACCAEAAREWACASAASAVRVSTSWSRSTVRSAATSSARSPAGAAPCAQQRDQSDMRACRLADGTSSAAAYTYVIKYLGEPRGPPVQIAIGSQRA